MKIFIETFFTARVGLRQTVLIIPLIINYYGNDRIYDEDAFYYELLRLFK